MRVAASKVFGCDYRDLEQVKALARQLGKGMTVIKRPSSDSYSITHTERLDLYEPSWVMFQT